MANGGFCFVLHGHLPYVLRHGLWPHGEDWLYEAAAETYLPLLRTIGHCALHKASPKLTVGLTPVLLEQLHHEHFRAGFQRFLEDRIQRAKEDRKDFEGFANGHMVYLADRWIEIFSTLLAQFLEIDRNIPAAFARYAAEGHIEILTSAATHGYLPLLYEDASIRAQLRAGLASSHRILGFKPTGMWLPECAYRPGGPWQSPIGWSAKPDRIAIENLVADENINHFFVENHLIEGSRSEWARDGEHWRRVGWDESQRDPNRGWRSVNEGHGVNSDGTGPPRVVAFARDPRVCEQVWSGAIGYPADGAYLEFHKKWGAQRGLRYWKVTGKGVDLGDKHLYHPGDEVPGKLFQHVQHFCQTVKQRLEAYRHRTGRYGLVVATFDAELFGHWWFEGPEFIRDVILTLNADPDVDLLTTEQAMERAPVDKCVAMPEGSWGEEGDHRVWSNPQVNWMWEIAYRCEANFGRATFELPWRDRPDLAKLLKDAGRELLLLQASDWPFIITRNQAVDYGIKRFIQHVSRFETLLGHAEKLARDSAYLGKLDAVEEHEVKDAELHDIIFPDIDLNWWRM